MGNRTLEELSISRLYEMKHCEREIDRLSDFLLKNYPHQIGRGNLKEGESAVDVAIRLLNR